MPPHRLHASQTPRHHCRSPRLPRTPTSRASRASTTRHTSSSMTPPLPTARPGPSSPTSDDAPDEAIEIAQSKPRSVRRPSRFLPFSSRSRDPSIEARPDRKSDRDRSRNEDAKKPESPARSFDQAATKIVEHDAVTAARLIPIASHRTQWSEERRPMRKAAHLQSRRANERRPRVPSASLKSSRDTPTTPLPHHSARRTSVSAASTLQLVYLLCLPYPSLSRPRSSPSIRLARSPPVPPTSRLRSRATHQSRSSRV